jgi:hypothetical protein
MNTAIPFESVETARVFALHVSRLIAWRETALDATVKIARKCIQLFDAESLYLRTVAGAPLPSMVVTPQACFTGPGADHGSRSCAAQRRIEVPIRIDTRVLGVLELCGSRTPVPAGSVRSTLAFLAEQIGSMWLIDRLEAQNGALAERSRRYRSEIDNQKTIRRAVATLMRQNNINETRAKQVLEQESRRLAKPIPELASAVMTLSRLSSPDEGRSSRCRIA